MQKVLCRNLGSIFSMLKYLIEVLFLTINIEILENTVFKINIQMLLYGI